VNPQGSPMRHGPGPHGSDGHDRRGDPRHGVAPRVTVTTDDGRRLRGDAANLSLGGLFVFCPPGSASDLAPDTDCRVRLAFRGGSRPVVVDLLGRVTRAEAEGLAIAFTYVDADNHARLHEALSGLAATPEG